MKSKRWFLALAAVLAVATVPFAVAGEEGYKCTSSTQDCLDMMAQNLKERGWVGLELDSSEGMENLVVKDVVADSPAQAAGFKSGDRLVAVNGIELAEENHEALGAAKKAMKPGKQVTYTVERDGAIRKLAVTLAPVPDEVLAQWVGNHMLEHASVEIASN